MGKEKTLKLSEEELAGVFGGGGAVYNNGVDQDNEPSGAKTLQEGSGSKAYDGLNLPEKILKDTSPSKNMLR